MHPSLIWKSAECTVESLLTICSGCADTRARQRQRTAPACDGEVWDHITGGSARLEHGGRANLPVGSQVSPEPS